jgi:hypothetical protein
VSALRDFLLAPPAARPTAAVAPVMPPAGPAPRVALLAAVGDLPGLGAAVALACLGSGSPVGLLLIWTGAEAAAPPAGPALPAARRLAAALVASGQPATAAGRLARAALPADPVAAAADATVALGLAGAVPAVLALGARHGAFDAALAGHDAILVAPPAGAPPALRALALSGVDGLTPVARLLDAAPGRGARALAQAGLVAPRDVRAAVTEALA